MLVNLRNRCEEHIEVYRNGISKMTLKFSEFYLSWIFVKVEKEGDFFENFRFPEK